MVKQVFRILILLAFLNSCTSKTDIDFENYILKTHVEAANNIDSDSTYSVLKSINKNILETKFSNDSLIAENNFYLGQYFQSKEELDSAAYYFYKAADQVNGFITSEREVNYFYYCWNASKSQNKYGDCLAVNELFEQHIDSTKSYSWLALNYYMFENVYIDIPDYDKALIYNKKRIDILDKASQAEFVPSALINRARIKSRMNDKEGAYLILDSLIHEKENLSDNLNMELFNSYGVNKYFDAKYATALDLYLKGLEYAKKVSNSLTQKSDVATCYGNIAEVYMDLGNYQNAKTYLDSVKQLSLNTLSSNVQKDILKYQIRYAVETDKEISDVLSSLENLYNYQEATYEDKFSNELLALKEASKKEKLLLKEKQDIELKNLRLRTQFLVLLLISIVIIAVVFMVYKQRQFKFEKQDLQMQQRLFRSQMNPHFISNTLYAIQNLVKKDQDKASIYLVKFSRLLRLSLENSLHNYVSLEKELETISQYLELQLLKFPNKFIYNFEINDIDTELVFIPPMLIQPLVENSIIHGFSGIDYKGKIEICVSMDKTFLLCEIKDNGIGINPNQSNLRKSISTKLISDFIYKSTKTRIIVKTINKSSDKTNGTLTKFYMPYKTNLI